MPRAEPPLGDGSLPARGSTDWTMATPVDRTTGPSAGAIWRSFEPDGATAAWRHQRVAVWDGAARGCSHHTHAGDPALVEFWNRCSGPAGSADGQLHRQHGLLRDSSHPGPATTGGAAGEHWLRPGRNPSDLEPGASLAQPTRPCGTHPWALAGSAWTFQRQPSHKRIAWGTDRESNPMA